MHQITCTVPYTIAGSIGLYQAVRTGFISQSTSMKQVMYSKWRYNRQTAEKILHGECKGGMAPELMKQLLEASNIHCD